jgi:hypothetical protein
MYLCRWSRVNTSKNEIKKIEETRSLKRRKNWCREVIIRQSEANSGLANYVVNGEDDIVLSPYFLKYMNGGLEIYRKAPNVISIHAHNYPISAEDLPETFFIKGADCGEWDTWASEWELSEMDSDKLLKQVEAMNAELEFYIQGSYPYT